MDVESGGGSEGSEGVLRRAVYCIKTVSRLPLSTIVGIYLVSDVGSRSRLNIVESG